MINIQNNDQYTSNHYHLRLRLRVYLHVHCLLQESRLNTFTFVNNIELSMKKILHVLETKSQKLVQDIVDIDLRVIGKWHKQKKQN